MQSDYPDKSWQYINLPQFDSTLERYDREILDRIDRARKSGTDFAMDSAITFFRQWEAFQNSRILAEEAGQDPSREPFQMALENGLPIRDHWHLKLGIYNAYYLRLNGAPAQAIGVLVFSDYERPLSLIAALGYGDR